MPKLQHRPVNVDQQLSAVGELSRLLRAQAAVPKLAEIVATLLEPNEGPTPLVELFNWAHEAAVAAPTIEPLRDALFELLRLCGQIDRYCCDAKVHPDLPREPFNGCSVAERLDDVVARLKSELKCCHAINAHRRAS
jgi:hypothetical protein